MPDASWIREPEFDHTLEENWLFQLRRERYRSRQSHKSHDFYVMHIADAVNVVALTPNREAILVRQFRAGSESDSLETPGGLVDEHEDPVEAGIRELLEETGYAGDTPWVLGTVWSNPSIMTSRITTLVIFNARPAGKPRPDDGEEVQVVLVPSRSLPAMIRDGKINHALAVAGLLWWMAAELPETPMASLPESGPPWYQFRLKTLVGLVLVSAAVMGILRNLGVPGSIALAFTLSVPVSHTIVSKGLLGSASSAVLIPEYPLLSQRFLRAFAILGMSLGICFLILIFLRIIRWI